MGESAEMTLEKAALANLDNGGRGIGNIVESYLINPLARFLFDNDAYEEATVEIDAIDESVSPVALVGKAEHKSQQAAESVS